MALLQYLNNTIFDHGAIGVLPKELKKLGLLKPLIATDPGIVGSGLLDRVLGALAEDMPRAVYAETPGNPTETAVKAALAVYREAECDGVICLGGGSSMDLGKAVALLATHPEPLSRYDPVEGGSRRIGPIAPVIAVPTTSGTGSEVSVGSVIVLDDGRKVTFVSPRLIPPTAICDPDLTLGLPPLLTAATGMDAITHCIEAVLSPAVNPPADGVGLDGLERGWRHIERAVADGGDKEARWHMMMASTEGAMAFIKGLGAVHAMAHALGRLKEPKLHHGTLNAVILPTLLRFNDGHAGDKYDRLRHAMGLSAGADLSKAVVAMNRRIGLPANLGEMGVTEAMIPDLVPHAVSDLASRTNPRKADEAAYERLYREAIG